MKTAEMNIGQDYAYDRHAASRWSYGASKVTVLAFKVNAESYARATKTWGWSMKPEVTERIRVRSEEAHKNLIAAHNLPDLPIIVEDEMQSVVAVLSSQWNRNTDESEQVIRLVNARYITMLWDQYEQEQAEKKASTERARIAREKAAADKAIADAQRKVKQEQWTRNYPAVGEAFASIGMTVPQGIDGLHLSPEQALVLAEFIRSNTTAVRAA